jgi:DNA polymerase (family 10)
MGRRNEDVARLLENIAKLVALKGESPYRVRAYREAARTISAMTEDVEDLHRAGRLQDIRGVGESIASKIGEYLDTGRSSYYESLKGEVPVAAVELLEVPGVGPVRARLLHERLGITSVAELEKAAREHKLRGLRGFGERLEQKIATEAARVAQRTRRMLLGVALPAAEEVVRLLRRHPAVREVDPAGSIRRMKETVGDIDILASSDRPLEVMYAFTTLPIVEEVLAKGPTRGSILTREGLQIDIRVIKPDEYGSALLYFTGSKDHNIALRTLVMQRGWKLSEYGLFNERDKRIAGRDEEEVYRALEMDWIPPELRENRGEIDAARHHQLPQLVEPRDIKGDLHVHTDWSDGHDPPEQVVEEAIARGYQYLAITDHSKGLGVARGLSADMVRQQRRLVDRLNEFYAPFRILHGTEVNILPDGSLDYPEELLAEFDIVTASVHSAFGQPREQMTRRILRALQNPLVDSLNHPTGRILQGRAGYEMDMDAVIRVAAENGVALEINGQPDRLDLDDVWSHRVREAGGLVVCDSDAHSVRQMEYVRYAVATARRGWVEPGDVLNALALDRLLAHLARRGRRARAA